MEEKITKLEKRVAELEKHVQEQSEIINNYVIYNNTCKKADGKLDTAPEGSVQEQNKFIPEDSNQKYYTSGISTTRTC